MTFWRVLTWILSIQRLVFVVFVGTPVYQKLPETNMANGWLGYEDVSFWGPGYFQGRTVSFREGNGKFWWFGFPGIFHTHRIHGTGIFTYI